VVFDQRVAIGKATAVGYALDVSGNVRINGGTVPTLTDDLVFLGNLQATKPVGIGKVYAVGYALDISGNVRIANGNLTGGGVVSVSNENTFTANQTFNNPVGFGKIWDSVYAIDVSGSVRITGGSVIGGNVASIKTDNSYDGKQTFLSQVGIRKTWDNAFSLDVSGNMRIANGNLTGGNVASLIAQNTFTMRNRFNDALTINCNFTTNQLDVSGNMRVQNGTSTFQGNVSMTGTQATVTNNPINDSGIVNRGYANTNYARLTSNNILTGNQDWKSENNLFDYPPFCATGPTDSNHLCRKSYVDGAFIDYATANTTYSGFNDYAPHLPTSLVTPTLPEQFTTKAYVDSVAVTGATTTDVNTWTNTNTFQGQVYFDNYLPRSDIVPTESNQLVNKEYADSQKSYLLGQVNTWSEFNTFQDDLGIQGNNVTFSITTATAFLGPTTSFAGPPTCVVDASLNDQLTRKQYVDTRSTILLDSANTWMQPQVFQGDVDFSGNETEIRFGELTSLVVAGGTNFGTPINNNVIPTEPAHVVNLQYMEDYISTRIVNLLAGTNFWGGENQFLNPLTCGVDGSLNDQLTRKQYVDDRCLRTVDSSQNYVFKTNMTSLTSGIRNTALGFEAGNGIIDGSYNVCLGYNAGQNVGSNTSNCIFLGSNSGALGGTYSNSIAIGSNVNVVGSNQIRIGTTAHTTEIRGEVALRGQTLYSIVDVSQNITIGANGYLTTQFYAVDISGTISVNFISTAATQSGQTTTFRRVGGNTSAQVLSTSSNIYPLNSFTQTNVILDASENLVRITRLRDSSGTGGWYKM
jgi:hypothetical protein